MLRVRKDYHDKLKRFQLASPHLLADTEIEEELEHIDDLVKWQMILKNMRLRLPWKQTKSGKDSS